MAKNTVVTSKEDIEEIHAICTENGVLLKRRFGHNPKAAVQTFGCQQNEADSELLKSMLQDMGCTLTPNVKEADVIVFNTCAIRDHAEMRVYGNLGELSHVKAQRPNAIIALCGCMAQQDHVAQKVKNSYPHVDMVFGTHALSRFPALLQQRLDGGRRAFDLQGDDHGIIIEGIQPLREKKPLAWLSIMYGCNNFCTYCVVPHVRGRERSRTPEAIEAEFVRLVNEGYKDITLLGQNVNSYGKDLGQDIDFPALLARLARTEGDYRIRFMTSHPKDATQALFDVMARHDTIAKSIHLPVQAGNNRVLNEMNRRYTAEEYKKLVGYARSVIPNLAITSDIIVGFPGETEEEFKETLALLKEVEFDSLFTFIFSPRKNTRAYTMADPVTREQKQVWFDALLDTQNEISRRINSAFVGKTVRVLISGPGQDKNYPLEGRTDGFKLVHIKADESMIGTFQNVKIEGHSTWALFGRVENS